MDLKTRRYASCNARADWTVRYCTHSRYFRLFL